MITTRVQHNILTAALPNNHIILGENKTRVLYYSYTQTVCIVHCML